MINFFRRVGLTIYYFCYWTSRGFVMLPGLWQLFRLRAPRVTFFGGHKIMLTDRWALDARALAKKCVEHDITLITGGGTGIMEATARGAQDAQPKRVACFGVGFEGLKEEEAPTSCKAFICMRRLVGRKWLMTNFSKTFVIFPGGVGTYNEFTEVLTLLDMEMLQRVPFILYGKSYWQPLITWMKETGIVQGFIASELLKYVVLVDDVDTAFTWILRACKKNGTNVQV